MGLIFNEFNILGFVHDGNKYNFKTENDNWVKLEPMSGGSSNVWFKDNGDDTGSLLGFAVVSGDADGMIPILKAPQNIQFLAPKSWLIKYAGMSFTQSMASLREYDLSGTSQLDFNVCTVDVSGNDLCADVYSKDGFRMLIFNKGLTTPEQVKKGDHSAGDPAIIPINHV